MKIVRPEHVIDFSQHPLCEDFERTPSGVPQESFILTSKRGCAAISNFETVNPTPYTHCKHTSPRVGATRANTTAPKLVLSATALPH